LTPDTISLFSSNKRRNLSKVIASNAVSRFRSIPMNPRIARQMGTSVVMLERHYSKLTASMAADRLAG
jgi:hypothetical protein